MRTRTHIPLIALTLQKKMFFKWAHMPANHHQTLLFWSTAPWFSLVRFLTLLRATFVEARESGSDVDAAALEVGHQNSLLA